MEVAVIQLTLPPHQYEQLVAVAQSRQIPVGEMARTALIEWLERQAQLERARTLMRQLGQGLAAGCPPHDTARRHDAYLYSRERQ